MMKNGISSLIDHRKRDKLHFGTGPFLSTAESVIPCLTDGADPYNKYGNGMRKEMREGEVIKSEVV